jgi:hypothetical protein
MNLALGTNSLISHSPHINIRICNPDPSTIHKKNTHVRYLMDRTPINVISIMSLITSISGEPEDYDEIADDGISLDYANRVLNADDDMDTDAMTTTAGNATKEEGLTKNVGTTNPGGTSTTRPRLSSTASSASSSASSFRPISSTLTQLYSTTAKAREAAFPPRVLGGGRSSSLLALWCSVGRHTPSHSISSTNL